MNTLTNYINSKNVKRQGKTEKMDVIIVMSGGLKDDGTVNSWVKKRLDLAIRLYHKNHQYIICTSAGTYHKPSILDDNKYPIHEATACATYLIENGVDPFHIVKETASYDTLGCVYFCLLLFAIPRNWSNIYVITSDFHMSRVIELFIWIFNLHQENKYNFVFLQTGDEGIPENILRARIEKELRSLKSLKENVICTIKSMADLHEWIYTEHKAYSCTFLKSKDIISDEAKKSY